ncbi:hypothetical protein [Nakamurella panacisegetis]|nr:hypothetical protein [Nakamurella panacisegetis]
MIRRLVDLAALAVVPWLLACLISLAEWPVFVHGSDVFGSAMRDLFTAPGVLIPVVVLTVAAVIAAMRQRNPDSVLRTRWVAGGWFAGWSTFVIAALGLCWGGGYGAVYLTGWVFLTGYVALLWIAGAHVWRSTEFVDRSSTPGMSAAAARSLMQDQ